MLACGERKYCPKCKTEKHISEFGKAKDRADGLAVWCLECNRTRNRARWASSPETRERKGKRQKERMADPVEHERQLERQRTWYHAHYADPEFREQEKNRNREAWATSEQRRTKHAATYKKWAAEHREELSAKHAEHIRERYANDKPFRLHVREWFRRRRNMQRGNGGQYELEDWQALVEFTGDYCPACGKRRKLELDHVVPVSKGGSSSLTNIQPLCRRCNASKGDETIDYRTPMMLQWLDLVTD